MQLEGKVALVTGAGSGIGRALASELAGAGARLLLVGRRPEVLEETRALLAAPQLATVWPADITDEAARRDLVARMASVRRLDLLVNNAGAVVSGPLAGEGASDRRRMVEVNLIAPMELTIALLPMLEASAPSRIVNIGSMFGDIAFPYFSAYSATKFGLRGWSDAIRRELAEARIGVTYAAPRGTRTPAAESFAALALAFDMRLDPPEKVAREIVRAVKRDARTVYPRGMERGFVLLQRVLASTMDKALGAQLAKATAKLGG